MLEKDHCDLLKGLLTQRKVFAILDEVVHEPAKIELVGQDFLVDDLEPVDIDITLGEHGGEGRAFFSLGESLSCHMFSLH